MPAYVYRCPKCSRREWVLRRIADRNKLWKCSCGEAMQRLMTPPTMHVWNTERRFPNVSPGGDGSLSFESRSAYEQHLRDHGLAEVAHDGKIERPHGNVVVKRYK